MPLDQGLFNIISAQAAESCSQGMKWDANLGRCLTDVETAKVMQATASCDPQDVECYKKNAQAAFDKEIAEDSSLKEKKAPNKFMSVIGNAGAVSMALYSVYSLFKTNPSTCAKFSHGFMVAGGATAFIGELYANQKHKKNLKEIEKDWKKIVNTNYDGSDKDSKKAHASAAQAEAFEMLARVEDSNAENAKLKSTIHAIAAAAFAGAAVAALLEVWPDGGVCPQTMNAPASDIDSNMIDNINSSPAPAGDAGSLLGHHNFDFLENKSIHQIEINEYLRGLRKSQYITSGVLKDDLSAHILVLSSPLDNISPQAKTYHEYENVSVIEKETGRDLLTMIKFAASQFSLFPAAHADAGAGAAAGALSKAKAGLGSIAKSVNEFMSKAVTRAAIGTVLSGWSLVMFKHTKSQQQASKNRAEKLREMKAEFAGAAGVVNMCTPEDRSNTSKPECYCYTPEGQRNPGRTNSQICQKLWSGTLAGAQNYKASTTSGFSGCVDSSNNYDASCACKKSSKGCLTVSTKGITGIGTGGLSLLNAGMAPLNDMTNGNFAKAEAAESGSVNNAMRLLKAAEQIANQPAYKGVKDKIQKDGLKLQNDLLKASSSMGAPQLADSGFNPGNVQDAVNLLEKQLAEPEKLKINDAKNPQTASGDSSKKSPVFDLNFAPDEEASGANEQVAQVMKQQFDYAQNDINQSQTNLFELLSNRYQRSGLRRLFDEEGKMPADAPATTDISN